MEWGDLSFQNEASGDFTSTCANKNVEFSGSMKKEAKRSYTSVDSRDIKLFYLQK